MSLHHRAIPRVRSVLEQERSTRCASKAYVLKTRAHPAALHVRFDCLRRIPQSTCRLVTRRHPRTPTRNRSRSARPPSALRRRDSSGVRRGPSAPRLEAVAGNARRSPRGVIARSEISSPHNTRPLETTSSERDHRPARNCAYHTESKVGAIPSRVTGTASLVTALRTSTHAIWITPSSSIATTG